MPSADNQGDCLKDPILIQTLRILLWWISEGASADAEEIFYFFFNCKRKHGQINESERRGEEEEEGGGGGVPRTACVI